MSENLEKLFTTQYSTTLELRLQQQGSKLRGKTREGSHTGRQASPVNQMGPTKLQTPQGRFAPKKRTDADYFRRWVFPKDGDLDQLVDSFDELRTLVDPKSQYVVNAANAVGRAWDDEIILAATGTAYIGQGADVTTPTALSTESFDTTKFRIADTFGAGAATGLNVAKLIEAKRILRHYENDLEMDEPTLICGSQQESDLLNQVQVVSTEFNDKPVLVDGKVVRMLGFNIVYIERLPTYTTNTRGVLAFVKSGMYLGMWKDMQNSVSQRRELSGEPWGVYTMVSYGATRLEEGKVIQIACLDSTGAAITP